MMLRVRQTIEQFHMISPGDRVVAGISGGADSVALLLCLDDLRKELEFDLTAVHINHMIRPDAMDDATFVKELCERLSIPFKLFEIDVKKLASDEHLTIEEAGRKARYEAYRSLSPDKIAVGHHRDDLAETVLLNMSRGSGLHGLIGIAPVNDDIVRPLLYVSRSEIEEFLSGRNQSYQTDSTNLSTDYVRNRIRLEVLPYLNEKINERSSEHIASLAADMNEIKAHIDNETDRNIKDMCVIEPKSVRIDKSKLCGLDSYMARELILKAFEMLTPKRKDIIRAHVQAVYSLVDAKGEKHVDLPYELEAISSYESIIIRLKEENKAERINIDISPQRLQEGVSIDIEDMHISARVFEARQGMTVPTTNCTKWFDYDKIKCSVSFRNRLEGDYLIVTDTGSKKSLKDYMINEKIPREERDKILLLALDNHIIWVVGWRISADMKITEKTQNILEVNITKG